MGMVRIDHILMILGISLQMVPQDREVVTREMIRGFNDAATEAGTLVTGGQSIMNPWPIIGGVANVVCEQNEFIRPNSGEEGDVIILTKPLGTQVAVNALQWMNEKSKHWKKVEALGLGEKQVKKSFNLSVESMAHLNRDMAAMMMKYGAHGATDVTGFGILGHAKNLVEA
eukprot:CAMPEP_0202959202 /NCGR_PEP_ID=MMETSP1396-20130829/3455_1 /ASSEMBLY_ACC=CAM_ASM_000872 /TAXON_ID= /ORGANISM="Pseudokeronopsis sp., Strain Brazil" /LENGTH=170 /DNA_ID=CAMNT_0049677665 /DNA_START=335 /DNA_END=847 /DNA_ORIENTATION=-